MEFPLTGLVEANATEAGDGSLYSRKPCLALSYAGVLGVAAVVGTCGNLVVIIVVTIKHIRRSRLHWTKTTGNDSGRVFIANLAFSDMIVTAVINPLAIAGLCIGRPFCDSFKYLEL